MLNITDININNTVLITFVEFCCKSISLVLKIEYDNSQSTY